MTFPKLLHIQVTEEDIEFAKIIFEKSPGFRDTTCPIAQAVRRMGYTVKYVQGKGLSVFNEDNLESIRYYLPERAQAFIELADSLNDEVTPIKFIALRRD